MLTYSVEILDPKAVKLLNDLADLHLIHLKKEPIKINKSSNLPEILIKGPIWGEEEYRKHLDVRKSINKFLNK